MRAVTALLLALLGAGCPSGGKGGADTVDADGDGYSAGVDCDDNDPSVYPGATEIWYDLIDESCDGGDDNDADGDGYAYNASYGRPDCDDADPTVHENADDIPELGAASDCGGMVIGARRYGEQANDYALGVEAAGDVNGDGVQDLFLGTTGWVNEDGD